MFLKSLFFRLSDASLQLQGCEYFEDGNYLFQFLIMVQNEEIYVITNH